MESAKPKSSTVSEPLTIEHGRQLFNQGREISEKLTTLSPLLTLLETPESSEGEDPIALILQFLESSALREEQQTALLQTVNAKLDALLNLHATAR